MFLAVNGYRGNGLAENISEQVGDVPGDEAGGDGQDQSCISPIDECVLNLTPERSHFCASRFDRTEKKAIVPERGPF